jgi:hypothetical protein
MCPSMPPTDVVRGSHDPVPRDCLAEMGEPAPSESRLWSHDHLRGQFAALGIFLESSTRPCRWSGDHKQGCRWCNWPILGEDPAVRGHETRAQQRRGTPAPRHDAGYARALGERGYEIVGLNRYCLLRARPVLPSTSRFSFSFASVKKTKPLSISSWLCCPSRTMALGSGL